jgi:hypothetical protein
MMEVIVEAVKNAIQSVINKLEALRKRGLVCDHQWKDNGFKRICLICGEKRDAVVFNMDPRD